MKRVCDAVVPAFVSHELPLPQCCPVSGNPFPGSTLRVSYLPAGTVVPVENLAAWIDEYRGGNEMRSIRNMEEMIQDIAVRCADEVGVAVRVVANLQIKPPYGGDMQTMRVSARGRSTNAPA